MFSVGEGHLSPNKCHQHLLLCFAGEPAGPTVPGSFINGLRSTVKPWRQTQREGWVEPFLKVHHCWNDLMMTSSFFCFPGS